MSSQEEKVMEENVELVESAEDSDSDSDTEDLKKFEQTDTKNILVDFHPHLKHISNKEMYALSNITRDKTGRIIDDLHTTMPILTRYEKAKIIGLRAKQINNGSKIFVEVPHNVIEGLTIAEMELEAKRIPFIIRRPMPNGGSEYWKVSDLEILE